MIPRILHQTFRSEAEIPDQFRPLMATWRRIHPDWGFRFWSDSDCERLLHEWYPRLVPVYDQLSHNIQRNDFMRYLILHHEGGVYADLDYELLASMEPFLDVEYFLAELHPGMVGNALMGSVKGWALWLDFIDRIPEAVERSRKALHSRFHRILYTAGPGHLNEFVKDMGLIVEPWQTFAPIPDNCTHLLQLGPLPNGAVAKHWWSAGWVNGETYQPKEHTQNARNPDRQPVPHRPE